MINNESQTQKAGNNSTNYQAQGNITIVNQYGITEENVKEFILETLKDNLPAFREIALEEANKSIQKISDFITEKIAELNSEIREIIFKRLVQPDMQIALIEVQKNYAKYPDEDKLEQLTSLLLSKGVEERMSLRNHLLDEAIDTIVNISQSQIDFLSYLTQKQVFIADAKNLNEIYKKYIDKLLKYSYSFEKLTQNDIDYLDYLKCIKNRPYKIVNNDIVSILKKQYKIASPNENIKRELVQINNFSSILIDKDMNLPSIDLTPLGVLIAITNIQVKTGEIINWNFK